jgi:small subunit ribosomal protein S17
VSENPTKKARPIRCVVTSDKMNKSRVGTLVRLVKHERYGKYQRFTTKIMFHDEQNVSKAGDEVLITQTRPLSARKKFQLLEIVRKAAE